MTKGPDDPTDQPSPTIIGTPNHPMSTNTTTTTTAIITTTTTENNNHEQHHHLPKFLKLMPKIELHAHLNGCIRESTLLSLAASKNISLSPPLLSLGDNNKNTDVKQSRPRRRRTLTDCFQIFDDIHACVNDVSSLKRITRETLDDFSNDNVCYLELRSTPRKLVDCDDKRGYVETILGVMKDFDDCDRGEMEEDGSCRLIPRLLLSIDRSGSVDEAMDTARLARDFFREGGGEGRDKYVVGVDIGGNPTKNDLRDFIPALQLVRDAGMKVSVHCGELPTDSKTPNPEIDALLAFRPDRLGHALFLPPATIASLRSSPIPIECCPTSNTMTMELFPATHDDDDDCQPPSPPAGNNSDDEDEETNDVILHGVKNHPHLQTWLRDDYPMTIATDDPGVFHTTPTRELVLVAKAYRLGWRDVGDLVLGSCRYIFEERLLSTNEGEEGSVTLEMRMRRRIEELGRLLFCD